MIRVGAHSGAVHPAPLALVASGLADFHGEAGEVGTLAHSGGGIGLRTGDLAVGDDEELCQVQAHHLHQGGRRRVVPSVEGHVGLQGLADFLLGPGGLQHGVHVVAQLFHGGPLLHGGLIQGVVGEGLVHVVEHHVPTIVAAAVGHREPDLIAGEAQDGGHQLGHGVQNQEQGGLGAAALGAVLFLAVQTVLDDVQIEVGHVHHAEVVHRVGDHQELIVVVRLGALLHQGVQAGDGPAVQFLHLRGRRQLVGVKAVQIAQAVPGGVAELEVVLAELLEDLVRAADVGVVVGAGGPQAQQVRAILVDDLCRVHAVAQGLVHGSALAVHGPAVGDALLEGRALAEGAHGGQQRGLEPAAVLVQALQIHGGGPEALVLLHGGEVGGTGVEPAVQGIGLLGEAGFGTAVGAGEALRQDLLRLLGEPGVGAFGGEELGDGVDGLIGADGLAAVLAVEHGNGQAPLALAGDAPVVALSDHGLHPVNAPAGHPAHIVARGDGLFLEGLHGAEPLGRGPEDDVGLGSASSGDSQDDVLAGEEHLPSSCPPG